MKIKKEPKKHKNNKEITEKENAKKDKNKKVGGWLNR